jgi:hypothetical protein
MSIQTYINIEKTKRLNETKLIERKDYGDLGIRGWMTIKINRIIDFLDIIHRPVQQVNNCTRINIPSSQSFRS